MIVLGANILVRAILGRRVRDIIATYWRQGVRFHAPNDAFDDMREHVPGKMGKSPLSADDLQEFFLYIARRVEIISPDVYSHFETEARARLRKRDEDDWPILASALAMGVPVWTEDRDFFGTGIATWTTDRVEIFLKKEVESPEPSGP